MNALFRLVFCAGLAIASSAFAGPPDVAPTDASVTVAVVVEGSIPGFTQDQLAAFVCQEMAASHAASWHFLPVSDAASSPNRVVWRFKLLPYAGGAVKYIGPALSRVESAFGTRRAVGIDAKIYLNGKYQSSTFDQATIKGSVPEPSFGATIQKIMHSIVANAVASDPHSDTKPTAFAELFVPAAGSEPNRRS
jgi:hypothetical protein